MVTQEFAGAEPVNQLLEMGNRDSGAQSQLVTISIETGDENSFAFTGGGKDGGFTPGDENSPHLRNYGVRVNGPDHKRDTREGFSEDLSDAEVNKRFTAIAAGLGELSMADPETNAPRPTQDPDEEKGVTRAYDFAG